VVVLDEQGRKLDTASFPATPRGYRESHPVGHRLR
jgi:hypothetical protein